MTFTFRLILKKPMCSVEELTRHVASPSQYVQHHRISPFCELFKCYTYVQ